MREIILEEFGGPEVLTLREEAPAPVPAQGEALVRVHAAGLNPLDYKMRDGSSGICQKMELPQGVGRELVGEVLEAPAGSGLEPGQLVFGIRANGDVRGTYAEQVALDAAGLHPVPEGADPMPYGGLALVGLTAIAILEDAAELQPGWTVLIHGGSGGVGQMLIPLALEAGAAHVWATGREANAERIAELGATPISYDTQDWQEEIQRATHGRGVDLIIDTHYFSTFLPSLEHVADGGRIVAVPSLADLTPATERGITAAIPRLVVTPERLARLAEGFTEGRYPLEVSRLVAPEEIAAAHAQLEDGHTRGKLLLDLR